MYHFFFNSSSFSNFVGAELQNEWIISDIGIISGSIIKCCLITVEKPNLLISLAYRNDEIVEIVEPINTFKVC